MKEAVQILAESRTEMSVEDLSYVIDWMFDDFPPEDWRGELEQAYSEEVAELLIKIKGQLKFLLDDLEKLSPSVGPIDQKYVGSVVARADWADICSTADNARQMMSQAGKS
ncbi:MAG: hypothetical protein QE269_01945 [Fimbriimonas sp.]|nr:hypothetical protein [Fimbriimonas sp.]